jgi:uncharacterized damage-inducible protein DinB
MIEMIRDLVAHKGHANAALLSAVARSRDAAADPELRELLHHVLVSNRFWALSLTGAAFHAPEELASSREVRALVDGFRAVQAMEEGWLERATEADLATHLEGPLVPGGRCTAGQALMQVCLHSLGHRAQGAKLLRRHGVVPPATDFILWLVERPAARWP